MTYQPENLPTSQSFNRQAGSAKKLSRKPVPPELQGVVDHVIEHGYVIIENAFTTAQTDEAIEELRRLAESPEASGPAGAGGHNTLEGFNTRRIYALLNKSKNIRQICRASNRHLPKRSFPRPRMVAEHLS